MSVINEKWALDESTGRVVYAEGNGPWTGLPVGMDRPEVRRATAVLPEALAALKESAQLETRDGLCWALQACGSGRHDPRCAHAQDILRRAGVLP